MKPSLRVYERLFIRVVVFDAAAAIKTGRYTHEKKTKDIEEVKRIQRGEPSPPLPPSPVEECARLAISRVASLPHQPSPSQPPQPSQSSTLSIDELEEIVTRITDAHMQYSKHVLEILTEREKEFVVGRFVKQSSFCRNTGGL